MLRRSLLFGIATCLVLSACDAGSPGVSVGPRGGLVRSDDGFVTLEVPAGALEDSITLSIVVVQDAPVDAIGPTYSLEPFGVAFSRPAELRYDLAACSDPDPSGVGLVTERAEAWEMLGDLEIDPELGELRGSVMYTAAVAPVR